MSVGILVLAAGRSTRFGADKRLAKLPDGRRVIDALLDNVRATGLEFTVCLGVNDHHIADQLRKENVHCIRCSRADEGMGGTLAEASGHIPDWDGVIVALADMPWIAPDTYLEVATRLSTEGICVPVREGRRGHPVGFGSDFYLELRSLGGDTGARHLLKKYAQQVLELPVNEEAIHRDIDFPSDLTLPP